MYFHARRVFQLISLAILFGGIFVFTSLTNDAFAICGKKECVCPSCGSGGSGGSGGGGGGGGISFWDLLFPPPTAAEIAQSKAEKAQARRMSQAWDRGSSCLANKDYSCARREYKIAWNNCTKNKYCKNLKKNISITYSDEHWDWATYYYENKDYQNALAQYEFAYGYCDAVGGKTCKTLKRNIQNTKADILYQKGRILYDNQQYFLARQEYEKTLKFCKKSRLKCSNVNNSITYAKMMGPSIEGQNFENNKQWNEALKSYQKARQNCIPKSNCEILDGNIRLMKEHIEWDKGADYETRGNFKKAKYSYKKALKFCAGNDCDRIKSDIRRINVKIERDKLANKWLVGDQYLDNQEYSEALGIYEKLRNKCKSPEVCSYLDKDITISRIGIAWSAGGKLLEKENFVEALRYLEAALQDCLGSAYSFTFCPGIAEQIEIAERELLLINQPKPRLTLPLPRNDDIEIWDFDFEKMVREKLANFDDYKPPDIEGVCAYWDSRSNCDEETKDKDIDEVNDYLMGAIFGVLPDQQKVDKELKEGKITQEEWNVKATVLEREAHARIKNLDRVLATDKDSLNKEKAEIDQKFKTGKINAGEKERQNTKIDATLRDINDLQEGIQAATEAIEKRIIVMGEPILKDEEGNLITDETATRE